MRLNSISNASAPILAMNLLDPCQEANWILAWQFVNDIEVFIFGQEVEVANAVLFFDTWLNNRVPFVINDLVEFLGRKS